MTKKIVVKLGGSALQDNVVIQEMTTLVKGYRELGHEVVVIHGGGPAINKELTAKGISWQFINGQRQTTKEMMSVIFNVLAQKINATLVRALEKNKISAKGISGSDHEILQCTQLSEELMQVGKIEFVNLKYITDVLRIATPVIAPIGIGISGELYNINADWAAAKIAMALQADMLVFLTDQQGILDAEHQLLSVITPELVESLVQEGTIFGGMYTKVMTMIEAMKHGVSEVRVLHASKASDLLFSSNVGTVILSSKFIERRGESQYVHI